eukprot:5332438-Amphidinium_carterae.1
MKQDVVGREDLLVTPRPAGLLAARLSTSTVRSFMLSIGFGIRSAELPRASSTDPQVPPAL